MFDRYSYALVVCIFATYGCVNFSLGLLPDAIVQSTLRSVPSSSGQSSFLYKAEGTPGPAEGCDAEPGDSGDRVHL